MRFNKKYLMLAIVIFITICSFAAIKNNNASNHIQDTFSPAINDNDFIEEIKDNNFQEYIDDGTRFSEPKSIKINSVQQIPYGITRIKANEEWVNSTGEGIKVAVLDSGISNHEDLNIKGEFNVIDPNEPASDDSGHGTLVAGIIAAKNNIIGIVGVAPDVDLYAVKVLNASGSGFLPDLVKGIDWCINNDIQIINISSTVNKDFPLLKEAIDRALSSNIIVVAAAGNSKDGSVMYPAAYQGVISVGAIDKCDNRDSFSSIGKIDFCAPGVNVISTFKDGGYAVMSGTSMAAPHVTGILALLLADKRNDTNKDGIVASYEIKELLTKSAEDIGTKGYDTFYGHGLLKAN